MVYHQIPRVQCCNVPKALQNTDFKSASLTNQDWVVEFRAAVLILCSVIFAAATWALFEIREGQSPRRLDWFKWMHFWCSSAQVCFLLVPYVCLYLFIYILHCISSYTHVFINPRSLLSCTNTHFGVGLNEPSTLSRQHKVMMLLLMMMC